MMDKSPKYIAGVRQEAFRAFSFDRMVSQSERLPVA
jgi:hypothetical protein